MWTCSFLGPTGGTWMACDGPCLDQSLAKILVGLFWLLGFMCEVGEDHHGAEKIFFPSFESGRRPRGEKIQTWSKGGVSFPDVIILICPPTHVRGQVVFGGFLTFWRSAPSVRRCHGCCLCQTHSFTPLLSLPPTFSDVLSSPHPTVLPPFLFKSLG